MHGDEGGERVGIIARCLERALVVPSDSIWNVAQPVPTGCVGIAIPFALSRDGGPSSQSTAVVQNLADLMHRNLYMPGMVMGLMRHPRRERIEGAQYRSLLIHNGIEPRRISVKIEGTAQTWDQAIEGSELMQKLGCRKAVLVVQRLQSGRALMAFRRIAPQFQFWAVPVQASNWSDNLLWKARSEDRFAIYELLATRYYRLKGYV